MLTFNTNYKSCKKKKRVGFMHNCFDPLVYFYFAVKCTEISMQVIVCLWEVGGIIKLQNDSFVLSAFLEIRWPGKSRWLFFFMLEICLGFPWSQKWDILAVCAWVVTILQQKNVLGPTCLLCGILYHLVVIVLDIHWAFSCLTRNKDKN